MKETDFQRTVIEMAQALGWWVVHFRASMNARGYWSTAVQGDGAGWPDLILVKPPRFMVAELKGDKGKLSLEQAVWGEILEQIPGIEYYVWRPSDDVESILKGAGR